MTKYTAIQQRMFTQDWELIPDAPQVNVYGDGLEIDWLDGKIPEQLLDKCVNVYVVLQSCDDPNMPFGIGSSGLLITILGLRMYRSMMEAVMSNNKAEFPIRYGFRKATALRYDGSKWHKYWNVF